MGNIGQCRLHNKRTAAFGYDFLREVFTGLHEYLVKTRATLDLLASPIPKGHCFSARTRNYSFASVVCNEDLKSSSQLRLSSHGHNANLQSYDIGQDLGGVLES